jgi:hypothetical protein
MVRKGGLPPLSHDPSSQQPPLNSDQLMVRKGGLPPLCALSSQAILQSLTSHDFSNPIPSLPLIASLNHQPTTNPDPLLMVHPCLSKKRGN